MMKDRSVPVCSAFLSGCGAVYSGTGIAIAISPESPTTTDDLIATIDGAAGLAFRWSVNGRTRPDVTSYRVNAALTTKHEI